MTRREQRSSALDSCQSPREALALAIFDALEAGLIVPCAADPERWTSDNVSVLEAAALDCDGCPLTAECEAASAGEVWGAWAGRVLVPKWDSAANRRLRAS